MVTKKPAVVSDAVVTPSKELLVKFNENNEPLFCFSGSWSMRDLMHTKFGLFRSFKHYLRDIRAKEMK